MKDRILRSLLNVKKVRDYFLRLFVFLHNFSYKMISKAAVIENKGLHPKHEIMQYYKFFQDNISSKENVLDVGCGNGYVAGKVSKKAKNVTGIDIRIENIEKAKTFNKKKNLKFITGDATKFDFKFKQDVIILSNVLEHIDERIIFLKKMSKIAPKILIRVPLISRSWVDFYKKQKGFEYRLDKTHFIEYEESEIFSEIKEAGLEVSSYKIKWGEIFIVTKIVERSS